MKLIDTFPFAEYLNLAINHAVAHGTPHLVVDEAARGVNGLRSNVVIISASAVRNFILTDLAVVFDYTVEGKPCHFECHPRHVLGAGVQDAEGWCFFPNAGAVAAFVPKTDATKKAFSVTVVTDTKDTMGETTVSASRNKSGVVVDFKRPR